jgi:hypothetical protein
MVFLRQSSAREKATRHLVSNVVEHLQGICLVPDSVVLPAHWDGVRWRLYDVVRPRLTNADTRIFINAYYDGRRVLLKPPLATDVGTGWNDWGEPSFAQVDGKVTLLSRDILNGNLNYTRILVLVTWRSNRSNILHRNWRSDHILRSLELAVGRWPLADQMFVTVTLLMKLSRGVIARMGIPVRTVRAGE